ncbi:MAG TPA: sugar ABC transporter permease [Aggregatilinea sp.]|jgi:multiple sugar transport system permease protein|uniref:carbohydrate ABC transporter permease n=1 Tax=Aggregatilinea sp. TaxID=2806333 RepID=UPI002CC2FA6C|nr:sugar ABC transporter permease [Aggregatilinea sp.]HML20648.1 sugar ABC transporter permease [Aggregatilinea sp.]
MSVRSVASTRTSRFSPATREALTFYAMVSPWIIGFLVFVAYPSLRSLYLSFTHYLVGRDPSWAGFDNFSRMAHDANFWQSMKVTGLYVLGSVPGSTIIAIAVAMLLAQNIRGVSVWRTIYFLPSVVSPVAVAVLWFYVFNPEYGLINTLLDYIGINGPGWIFDKDWALLTVVFMSWWTVGGQIVIYLAGLKGIPKELYEAVSVDGGGPWAKFRHITIPMLSPTIFFNVVLALIGAFQIFEGPWILTRGGPDDATLTYMLNLYKQAFEFGNFGYASALAWMLFVIIMVFTLLVFRSSSLWVYYEAERK